MLRSTLLKLSESKSFANWVTTNGTTRRMARRFVAGETLDDAIAAARECNNAGMLASLDYLGENVSSTGDAQHSRDAYLEVFERIAQEKLKANVSCKLTQLGLDLNVDFCQGLVLSIVEFAARYDNFLRVDMEGSLYTQRTIDLVKRVRARNPAVGTVIQSYLYRSETDVTDLLAKVTVPTLVMHARNDAQVPLEAGRQLAAGIPGAKFVALQGNNHIPLEQDPATQRIFEEIRLFLGT